MTKYIFILTLLIFFMSCKDPNEVGSSLLKENSNTTFIDTFSIETEVVYYPENLLSSQATSLLVGKTTDELTPLAPVRPKSVLPLGLLPPTPPPPIITDIGV